jgi:acetyl esterase/lipase
VLLRVDHRPPRPPATRPQRRQPRTCYYAYKNLTFSFSTDVGTRDVKLVLITGQADDVCATWQSQKAAKALTAAGYDTTLVSIPGANHYTPMFHNFDHGKWITVLQDPAGQTTVGATLHAIATPTTSSNAPS